MNLLRYEFIDGPGDSINGMLRKLVTDLRYNRSMISAVEFREALPGLRRIEEQLQDLDKQISRPHRDYIDEIMKELDEESENETNIEEDLKGATSAIVLELVGKQIDIDELNYSKGKAEHYNYIQLSGYLDQRPVDANLLIAREVFRSICQRYNYIFIDLS